MNPAGHTIASTITRYKSFRYKLILEGIGGIFIIKMGAHDFGERHSTG